MGEYELLIGICSVVSASILSGIAYCGMYINNNIANCQDKLNEINDNLTGIDKSLKKIAEGKLETMVKQNPEE